jgi:2-polyprenyl-3-methyl-5-hydroxy-6-metoxy-1,4-benzoquinol methylase
MQNKYCYLCGNDQLIKRLGSVRDNTNLSILECIKCSLVFLSSFDHVSDSLYADGIMHEDDIGDGKALEIDEWISYTEDDDRRRFDQFKNILKGKDLLDFGCGVGSFIKQAREISNIAHGIELEIRLSTFFKDNNLIVYRDLSELNENKYDVITLFHVLEHIPDPRSLLEDLKSRLNINGQIIIEVPNVDDALLTLYKSEPFSHFHYWSPHLFYYSAKTLEKLALQSNLKINYIEQFQRYPLSNHLHWLAFGKPGGHEVFKMFNNEELHLLYSKKLENLGKCDTILASLVL